MGSGQSTRRLTIDNEETDIGVIRISETLVDRLSQNITQTTVGPAKEVRPTAVAEPISQTPVSAPVSQSSNIPLNAEHPTYCPHHTITALQIQQQKVQELSNQDNYWQNRLKNLEQKHSQIDAIINAEYKKAIDQLYSKDKKNGNFLDSVQPCKGNSDKVLKCYNDHPKEILQCSDLVEEFCNCIDERRARVIAARC